VVADIEVAEVVEAEAAEAKASVVTLLAAIEAS
jgi:hypothetical protein